MASLTASTRDGINTEPKARPISPKMSFPCPPGIPPAIPQVGWPDRDLERASLTASTMCGIKAGPNMGSRDPRSLSCPPSIPQATSQGSGPERDLERESISGGGMCEIKTGRKKGDSDTREC